MAIIINDMDMPDSCGECPMCNVRGTSENPICMVLDREVQFGYCEIYQNKMANCPLKKVDFEALEEAIPRYNNYDNMPIWKLKELLYGNDK